MRTIPWLVPFLLFLAAATAVVESASRVAEILAGLRLLEGPLREQLLRAFKLELREGAPVAEECIHLIRQLLETLWEGALVRQDLGPECFSLVLQGLKSLEALLEPLPPFSMIDVANQSTRRGQVDVALVEGASPSILGMVKVRQLHRWIERLTSAGLDEIQWYALLAGRLEGEQARLMAQTAVAASEFGRLALHREALAWALSEGMEVEEELKGILQSCDARLFSAARLENDAQLEQAYVAYFALLPQLVDSFARIPSYGHLIRILGLLEDPYLALSWLVEPEDPPQEGHFEWNQLPQPHRFLIARRAIEDVVGPIQRLVQEALAKVSYPGEVPNYLDPRAEDTRKGTVYMRSGGYQDEILSTKIPTRQLRALVDFAQGAPEDLAFGRVDDATVTCYDQMFLNDFEQFAEEDLKHLSGLRRYIRLVLARYKVVTMCEYLASLMGGGEEEATVEGGRSLSPRDRTIGGRRALLRSIFSNRLRVPIIPLLLGGQNFCKTARRTSKSDDDEPSPPPS